jgi:hypothetical protein
VAGDDVGAGGGVHERGQLGGQDLEVRGEEQRDVAARRLEALQLGRVAADVLARRVVDRAQGGHARAQFAHLLTGAVGAPVGDDDDLVLAVVRRKRVLAQPHQRLHILQLVIGRDDERDVHDPLGSMPPPPALVRNLRHLLS